MGVSVWCDVLRCVWGECAEVSVGVSVWGVSVLR